MKYWIVDFSRSEELKREDLKVKVYEDEPDVLYVNKYRFSRFSKLNGRYYSQYKITFISDLLMCSLAKNHRLLLIE